MTRSVSQISNVLTSDESLPFAELLGSIFSDLQALTAAVSNINAKLDAVGGGTAASAGTNNVATNTVTLSTTA